MFDSVRVTHVHNHYPRPNDEQLNPALKIADEWTPHEKMFLRLESRLRSLSEPQLLQYALTLTEEYWSIKGRYDQLNERMLEGLNHD